MFEGKNHFRISHGESKVIKLVTYMDGYHTLNEITIVRAMNTFICYHSSHNSFLFSNHVVSYPQKHMGFKRTLNKSEKKISAQQNIQT